MRTSNNTNWIVTLFIFALCSSSLGTINGMLNAGAILSLSKLEQWNTVKAGDKKGKVKYCVHLTLVLLLLGCNVHLELPNSMAGKLLASFHLN